MARTKVIGILAAGMVLAACSSGSSGDAQVATSAASSSMPSGAISALATEPGCYSMATDPTQDIEHAVEFRIPTDCTSPHHIEVFWVGDDGPDASTEEGQKAAMDACLARYEETFGVPAPQEYLTLEQQESNPLLMVVSPSPGAEAQQYPGRLVCSAYSADPESFRYLSRSTPFTR